MKEAGKFEQGEDFVDLYDADNLLSKYYGFDYQSRKKITIIVEDR